MKELLTKNAVFLVFFLVSSNAFSQGSWEFTGGPYGVNVSTLYVINQDSVLVGTAESGLFLFQPKKHSMSELYFDDGYRRVRSVVKLGDGTLLMTVHTPGEHLQNAYKLLKSDSTFSSWKEIDYSVVGSLTTLSSSLVDYTFGKLATRSGLARSSDYGVTWEFVGDPVGFLDDIIADQLNNYLYIVSSSTIAEPPLKYHPTEGIYVSDDFGESWQNINDESKVSLSVAGTGFLFSEDEFSTDFGETWHHASYMYIVHSDSSSIIYGGNYNGLYSSSNNGEDWQEIDNTLEVNSMVSLNHDELLIGAFNGLHIYNTHENKLINVSEGLFERDYNSIYESPGGRVYLAGASGVIFDFEKKKEIWNSNGQHVIPYVYGYEYDYPFQKYVYDIVKNNSGTKLYASTNFDGSIGYSTDQGRSWNYIYWDVPGIEVSSLALLCDKYDNIFIARGVELRKLPAGTNETEVCLNAGAIINVLHYDDNVNIYAGASAGKVFISSNNGESWTSFSEGLNDEKIVQIKTKDSYVYAATDCNIYKLNESDSCWASISANLPDFKSINDFEIAAGNIYVSLEEAGVYTSSNNGFTWEKVNDGLEGIETGKLLLSENNYIYISTNKGVYKFSKPLVSVKTPDERIPRKYTLHQNYPNPFNPVTNILYSLPVNTKISITVFDVLGRELAVLINEYVEAGMHNIKFDGSNLSSGVYIVNMKAGNFNQSRKILLLK